MTKTVAKLLKTSDVASLTGFTVRTVRNWCDAGMFPTAIKMPNRITGQWRIKDDDEALNSMLAGEDASELLVEGYKRQLEDAQSQITSYLKQLNEQDDELLLVDKKVAWYEENFPKYEAHVQEQESHINGLQDENLKLKDQIEKYRAWHEQQKQRAGRGNNNQQRQRPEQQRYAA